MADACPMPPVDMDGDGSTAGTDCDDNNPNRYPELAEVECDGIDNNCDCNEVCNNVTTDVCAPPGEDAGAEPADSGAVGGRDAAVRVDAGGDRPDTIVDDSCGCSATPRGPRGLAFTFLLLALGALVRTSRRGS
jgi:MYXO-CTERM domain-containing protein